MDKFIKLISEVNWNNVMECQDPILAYNDFIKTFSNNINLCTSVRDTKNKVGKKIQVWVTNGIICSIKKRDRLKKQVNRNKNNLELLQSYKDYRNRLKHLIKTRKSIYYSEQFLNCGNDMKKIYKLIKKATNEKDGKSNQDIVVTHEDGKIFSDDKEMANHCNKYFIDIGKTLASKIPNAPQKFETNCQNINDSMFLSPVNENELIQHINSLKISSSPGTDGITSRVIKKCHIHILKPLLHIINRIFLYGKIPEQFKESIITTIYKNGDKSLISNYRPISLINTFGKLFEKCLRLRLYNFMIKNKVLNKRQFGFRPGISTNEAMFELVNNIKNDLDTGNKSIAVFIDLTKAFDTVPHASLLNILETYGVRGIVLDVFKNYLLQRKQRVKIRNNMSDIEYIQMGVPQGTVLGPLLFILYLNSLLNIQMDGTIISYADDTVLLFKGETWEDAKEKTQRGMYLVHNWMEFNKLSININKTRYIAFTLTDVKRPDFENICIPNSNFKIKNCDKIKYLGVVIDKNLKWTEQINTLTVKLRRFIYKFYELRNFINKKLLIILYKTLVESILKYGIVVWGGLYNNALHPLSVIQNFIIKIILKKNKLYPTTLLYNDEILNVRSLYCHACCVFLYKHKHLQYVQDHVHETRFKTNNTLTIPFYRRDANQRFVTTIGPKIFNSLPTNIKNLNTLHLFQKRCKQYIGQNQDLCLSVL